MTSKELIEKLLALDPEGTMQIALPSDACEIIMAETVERDTVWVAMEDDEVIAATRGKYQSYEAIRELYTTQRSDAIIIG